jgi:hypothetical protein
MTYWWKPQWWDAYVLSIILLAIGGAFLGSLSTYIILEAKKWQTQHYPERRGDTKHD